MNREKTVVFFNPNTLVSRNNEVNHFLGISVEAYTERYLGLPTTMGRITSGKLLDTKKACLVVAQCPRAMFPV